MRQRPHRHSSVMVSFRFPKSLSLDFSLAGSRSFGSKRVGKQRFIGETPVPSFTAFHLRWTYRSGLGRRIAGPQD